MLTWLRVSVRGIAGPSCCSQTLQPALLLCVQPYTAHFWLCVCVCVCAQPISLCRWSTPGGSTRCLHLPHLDHRSLRESSELSQFNQSDFFSSSAQKNNKSKLELQIMTFFQYLFQVLSKTLLWYKKALKRTKEPTPILKFLQSRLIDSI